MSSSICSAVEEEFFFVLSINSQKQASRTDGNREMQRFADETGGAYFEANVGMTLEKIYSRIQDELRNQYSLGYTSDRIGA